MAKGVASLASGTQAGIPAEMRRLSGIYSMRAVRGHVGSRKSRLVWETRSGCAVNLQGSVLAGCRKPSFHWLPVCGSRRRVSSGLCRRAPHPRRQSAWVSSGESLFGTSGANRSTKLAQLRGCDSAVARRGRGRGSGSSTQRFTFPTFLKGGKGGKQ